MKTIYESILEQQNTQVLGTDLTSIINSRLVTLLKQSCNVDLSSVENPFIEASFVVAGVVDISFTFEYGYATLSVHGNSGRIYLTFYFNSDATMVKLPYRASRCSLKIDHNMNFIEATFKEEVSFSKAIFDNTYSSTIYCSFLLEVVKNSNSVVSKTFAYDNYLNFSPENMQPAGVPAKFFDDDVEFDNLFIDFIRICAKNPHLFYEVFNEYPSYLSVMDDISTMVHFWKTFHQQYVSNLALLKSRFMVLEMRLI